MNHLRGYDDFSSVTKIHMCEPILLSLQIMQVWSINLCRSMEHAIFTLFISSRVVYVINMNEILMQCWVI